jgi:hypothetical protein
MQQRPKALADRGDLRTGKIYLPVDRHQQLHGFHLPVLSGKLSTCVDKLVGKVLNGVAQNL